MCPIARHQNRDEKIDIILSKLRQKRIDNWHKNQCQLRQEKISQLREKSCQHMMNNCETNCVDSCGQKDPFTNTTYVCYNNKHVCEFCKPENICNFGMRCKLRTCRKCHRYHKKELDAHIKHVSEQNQTYCFYGAKCHFKCINGVNCHNPACGLIRCHRSHKPRPNRMTSIFSSSCMTELMEEEPTLCSRAQ